MGNAAKQRTQRRLDEMAKTVENIDRLTAEIEVLTTPADVSDETPTVTVEPLWKRWKQQDPQIAEMLMYCDNLLDRCCDPDHAQMDEVDSAIRQIAHCVAQMGYNVAQPEEPMLSTANMPGGTEEEKPLVILPSASTQSPIPADKVYSGADLGAQTRDVIDTRNSAPRKICRVTIENGVVYEIEFLNGRAKVPQTIADYIQRENPGGMMRVV